MGNISQCRKGRVWDVPTLSCNLLTVWLCVLPSVFLIWFRAASCTARLCLPLLPPSFIFLTFHESARRLFSPIDQQELLALPNRLNIVACMAKRRHLRSKEESAKAKLFNLDELINTIPIDVDIPILDECSGQKRPTTEIQASSSINLLEKPLNIVQIPSRQRRRPTTFKKKVEHKDPLDDELFLKHHLRAEKSEKKMTNIEKERVFAEYDYYLHCLEQLKSVCRDYETSVVPNQPMMLKITEPFTTILDPSDRNEVLLKVNLLIGEITKFTRTFERLRKLELNLKTLHNNFYHQIDNPEESDTEEEIHMDVKKLRESRFYRRLKHGPLLKIRFLDGTILVKDAISPPKVINF